MIVHLPLYFCKQDYQITLYGLHAKCVEPSSSLIEIPSQIKSAGELFSKSSLFSNG